jgi:hypothetical protein
VVIPSKKAESPVTLYQSAPKEGGEERRENNGGRRSKRWREQEDAE